MTAVTICSDFGAPKNKVCHCFHCFPIYLPGSDGAGCHDLSDLSKCWIFKPTFSLFSFTFIKRLFSSLLSAIRMVSSAYLRLLIFLLAIMIPACASSSPAFHMMYSVLGFPGGSDGRPGFDPWVGKIPWRKEWQPTPVFFPRKFHGQRNLAGYSPWGHKESETTEGLSHTHTHTHTHTHCI